MRGGARLKAVLSATEVWCIADARLLGIGLLSEEKRTKTIAGQIKLIVDGRTSKVRARLKH